MSDPEEKEKRQRRRQRNFIAKKLREDKRFRPKIVKNKKREVDYADYRYEEQDCE